MARPVAIRANYRDDAAYLLRLETAVLKDERRPSDWRNMVAAKIRDLANTFLDGEKPDVTSVGQVSDGGSKKRK